MTEEDPAGKPPCSREDALAVLLRLREAGNVAYFAGGCVRDLLLGHEPKDYDVATDAPPHRVRQLFANTQAVGAAFGVILVRQGRSQVEVATFRADAEYHDGRRPSAVRFTTAEEDAQRRDFTINGLFLDPVENRVIDYVDGQKDVAARRLRAIGEASHRFAEDHLRLLRAVRFAARFNFEIEAGTGNAMRIHAPHLRRISPERIADELRRMLTPATRAVAWPMLWDYALVDELFRFLPPEEDIELDRARSIFMNLAPGESVPFGLALAAATLCFRWQRARTEIYLRELLQSRSIGAMVRAMRQALRFSNDEGNQMEDTLLGIGPLLADTPANVATLKRFLARPAAAQSRALLAAIGATGLFAARTGELHAQLAELEKTDFAPPPFITGDDLTAEGYKPGPLFRRVLEAAYDAQLEGRVMNRDEALELARQLATPH